MDIACPTAPNVLNFIFDIIEQIFNILVYPYYGGKLTEILHLPTKHFESTFY